MLSANHNGTQVAEATNKNSKKNGYYSSNMVNYILQMLQ